MKLIIVGGVAGGATAAARARRLNENAEIVLFEKGEYISFANCGLPYYIGGSIKKRDELLLTTPEDFNARYNIDVRVYSQVISIDTKRKQVEIKDMKSGAVHTETYDKLILSPGAKPFKPPVEGVDAPTVFNLRNIQDTDNIKKYVDEKKPKSAVIVGGGFIGLEMAENLSERGMKITIVEMLDQVMAPLDFEMAEIVHEHLIEKGVSLELGKGVEKFDHRNDKTVVMVKGGREIECELVILSSGVSPDTNIAKNAGLELNRRGSIKVDAAMRTSDPDIYAVGDAVEIKDILTGAETVTLLAGPANRQGRIAADNVMGRRSVFNGTIGTAIAKVYGLTVASTGQSEKNLQKAGIPFLKSYTFSNSNASYYPGADLMGIKLLFSPGTGRLLGVQIVGGKGVDKRVDVISVAIMAGMTVYDLEELELAYAPPYSSAKDPVNMAGFVAANILKGDMDVTFLSDLEAIDREKTVLLDLRTKFEIKKEGAIENSVHIPVDDLRKQLKELDKDKEYILYCAIGLRGYIGYRILVQNGFKVKNFSGGYEMYRYANRKFTRS